ncbi:alpha/beta hydrolase [Desulfogranum mediterraneum]|uniref:alpha/beta hydrolase n=1 Tax=Desulfogranum mediterraneum TaxID=160661 RepID=UPI0003FEA399|nr:alpha/beta hydrolase [Desulfogranum mediterraneum]
MQVLLVAACGYMFLLAFLYFYQPRLLFFPHIPSRELEASPAEVGLAYESVQLMTSDKLQLHGWFVPAPQARGVVLFFHGNAGNISHRLESLLLFNRLRLSTLIFDYRGYGRSQGSPSEQGMYQDAEAGWQYLRRVRAVSSQQIILFGRSLGAAVASQLATSHTPGALILESGFTSVPDVAAELYPFLPTSLLSRFDYNAAEKLKQVACPVLVIHSPDDEIIPYTHGQALYEAAREPKRFLELRGGHNDGFLRTGEAYTRGLDSFLAVSLGSGTPDELSLPSE